MGEPTNPELARLVADMVLFSMRGGALHVLLALRAHSPEEGRWTFPGGHVDKGEVFDDAAIRELEEETGISGVELHRVDVFDKPDRDPRARVITLAYAAIVDSGVEPVASREASEMKWWPVDEVHNLELGFDHMDIFKKCLEWVEKNL